MRSSFSTLVLACCLFIISCDAANTVSGDSIQCNNVDTISESIQKNPLDFLPTHQELVAFREEAKIKIENASLCDVIAIDVEMSAAEYSMLNSDGSYSHIMISNLDLKPKNSDQIKLVHRVVNSRFGRSAHREADDFERYYYLRLFFVVNSTGSAHLALGHDRTSVYDGNEFVETFVLTVSPK